ncbi:Ribosome association toxin PasT (RatA) of the RatAB toxin-antitoxin module [Micromonospora pallida]|uniref:Ribosome association toxin PasT (RatA) of the RatAB toxin-antitoxin module n=1 Tax=Micromonospora pallida TaxID=145854 RepID=A0A1C6RWH1_9ACTN|nr:SRPBCC family protein [Micromonospora pallida]SCL21484.1 Ribosome association toxin PasT (RatA) of the RatAB toxin-antitoxin module [Micromonospora pallida]
MECSVVVHALLPKADAKDSFDRLADFAAYPEFTDTVRTVGVTRISPTEVESTWEVNFRKGILVWAERDEIDPVGRRIGFDQIRGDFAMFTGAWQVVEVGDDVRVEFSSRFDLGIASLASLIDPVACAALRDAVRDILLGLFGSDIEVHTVEAAPLA